MAPSRFLPSRTKTCNIRPDVFKFMWRGKLGLILSDAGYIKFHTQNEGHEGAQFVAALRYKPEGREFDSQWCN
jgi:hypothetical protein